MGRHIAGMSDTPLPALAFRARSVINHLREKGLEPYQLGILDELLDAYLALAGDEPERQQAAFLEYQDQCSEKARPFEGAEPLKIF